MAYLVRVLAAVQSDHKLSVHNEGNDDEHFTSPHS